ncbi:pilus assembly protein PilM [Glaciimonas sp. GG7]
MVLDIGSLFDKKSPPLVGIDISALSVRLVELSDAGNDQLRLERYASEPLPRGAVVDGNIENIDQVTEVVRRLWKKSGATTRNVALGMPSASVITKKIILPGGMSDDELELQVESEANQYIPFALDEVSLDFYVVGPAQHSPDDVEVLLAATRKEKVEDRVAIAEAAGLKPIVMDIESYAARGAINRIIAQLPQQGQGKMIGLFQIGAQSTHVSALLNGQLIYEREQPFGGHQLTQDIVRAYGLSYEEAEAKKRSGGLPESYQQEILNPFLESAAIELTRTIQFFFTSTPYTRVDQLYLAGGCAIIPGMVEAVAGRAKISTSVVSPFAGMQLASNVREKQLRNEAPAYLVACGLAMRRFG